MSPRLKKFSEFYTSFGTANLAMLEEVYVPTVVFKDPVHEVQGVEAMRDYLTNLCAQLNHCRFTFHHTVEEGDSAFLRWTMDYAHPKVAGGRPLQLEGVTEVTFVGEQVSYHCDYYDMGAMLYENLPVIGSLIRWLRVRLA